MSDPKRMLESRPYRSDRTERLPERRRRSAWLIVEQGLAKARTCHPLVGASSRNQDGTWRKKRSDADKPRKPGKGK